MGHLPVDGDGVVEAFVAVHELLHGDGLVDPRDLTAAITSDASPTGTPMFDVVWRAAFVVVTTLAAARARRWSLVVGAGLVVIGAAGWWSAAGLAALALTFVLAWEDKRSRIVGAAAGALIGLAALHLGWPTSTFATALLAAVAVGVIWVSGYRTSSRRVRRRVRFTAFGFIAFVAIGCSGGSRTAWSGMSMEARPVGRIRGGKRGRSGDGKSAHGVPRIAALAHVVRRRESWRSSHGRVVDKR